jgi:hypothetical protein
VVVVRQISLLITPRFSMLRIVLLVGSLALLAPRVALAQSGLEGAWELVERYGSNANGEWREAVRQPSQYLFMDGYYSIMEVTSDEPRTVWPEGTNRGNIGEALLRNTFGAFVANTGTYEVQGNRIAMQVRVALEPSFMTPGSGDVPATREFTIDGDSLELLVRGDGFETTSLLRRLR